MKIDLRKLAHSDTLPFSGTIDLSGEELYGAKPFQSPVVFSGEVTSHLDVLRLTGEVKTTYHTCCARCLKSTWSSHELRPLRKKTMHLSSRAPSLRSRMFSFPRSFCRLT